MNKFLRLILFLGVVVSTSTAQDMRIYMKKDSVAKFPIANIDSISFAPCLPDSFFVNGIYPNSDCITIEARPPFNWDLQVPNRPVGTLTYDFTLVEMSTKDTSLKAFDAKKPLFALKEIKEKSVAYPITLPKLMMGKIYAWRVRTYENNKLVAVSEVKPFYILDYQMPFDMRDVLCCLKNLVVNGTMQSGNTSGVLGSGGRIDNWQTGYGSPVVKSDTDGCNSPGYVQLQGNKYTGSAIKQTLQPGNRILQGKHYRFSACVRLRKVQKSSDYVQLKAIAYNSNFPATGQHPQPNSDLAIIGWTGQLTLNEWATASVHVWSPNRNFDNIAVYCYTNSGDTTAYCDIDNICLVETTDSIPCDDYAYDGNGNPIIDTSVMNQARDTTYTYYDEYTGLTSDLYSSQGNTSLDTWYSTNDSCASTGGYVPLNIQNMNFDDSLAAWGYQGTSEHLDSVLAQTFSDTTEKMRLNPIPPFNNKCDKPFVVNNAMPFGGRDIIFVHGLKLDHLCDRNESDLGALSNWPTSPNQFKGNGYYKKMAEDGWADHINTWLKSRGYTNRYLIVAYNCSQPLIVATHAVLTQIRNAMESGDGVVNLDPRDPRKTDCFGQSSVIVSHSTGGLVSDVAMSIAEKTKTDPALQLVFGNVGYIPDRVKTHVAFHSILAGSKMASLFLALQFEPGLISTIVNIGVCHNILAASPAMKAITLSSILVDLQPAVVTTLWNPFINSTPVPTITVAGGHPFGVDNVGIANWAIHPGLDDGVSTMSSQSGNPNFETGLQPSGYIRTWNPFKVYDMGIDVGRANSYYMNQTLFTTPLGYVGGSGITHLSATGMLQPVSSTGLLCENRYNNHYSFLQSASDHYSGPRGISVKDGYNPSDQSTSGYQPSSYHYTAGFGQNYEESRAITNSDIYTRGLVSPAVANMQQERIKGLYITIAIPIPNFSIKCCFKFDFWWSYYYIIIPIWERKYHNMVGFETETECSYVYKYVLRP